MSSLAALVYRRSHRRLPRSRDGEVDTFDGDSLEPHWDRQKESKATSGGSDQRPRLSRSITNHEALTASIHTCGTKHQQRMPTRLWVRADALARDKRAA